MRCHFRLHKLTSPVRRKVDTRRSHFSELRRQLQWGDETALASSQPQRAAESPLGSLQICCLEPPRGQQSKLPQVATSSFCLPALKDQTLQLHAAPSSEHYTRLGKEFQAFCGTTRFFTVDTGFLGSTVSSYQSSEEHTVSTFGAEVKWYLHCPHCVATRKTNIDNAVRTCNFIFITVSEV
jgi:hypothetical protein